MDYLLFTTIWSQPLLLAQTAQQKINTTSWEVWIFFSLAFRSHPAFANFELSPSPLPLSGGHLPTSYIIYLNNNSRTRIFSYSNLKPTIGRRSYLAKKIEWFYIIFVFFLNIPQLSFRICQKTLSNLNWHIAHEIFAYSKSIINLKFY